MAKDDYFVLAYKILAYLYECLKGKRKLDFSYLQPMTKDFPVEESYFCYIIENIYRSGYIEGVIMVPILGEPHPRIKYAENLAEFLQCNEIQKVMLDDGVIELTD